MSERVTLGTDETVAGSAPMDSDRALYTFPSYCSSEAEVVLLPSACQRCVAACVVALPAFKTADHAA